MRTSKQGVFTGFAQSYTSVCVVEYAESWAMQGVVRRCLHSVLLSCKSAGFDNSFKIRRVHSKNLVQLSDDEVDKQSNITYNAHPWSPIDDSVLATEHDSSIIDLLTQGYNQLTK